MLLLPFKFYNIKINYSTGRPRRLGHLTNFCTNFYEFFNFGKFVKIREFFAEVTNSRSMVKSQGHKSQKQCRAWVFTLLWVLASFSCWRCTRLVIRAMLRAFDTFMVIYFALNMIISDENYRERLQNWWHLGLNAFCGRARQMSMFMVLLSRTAQPLWNCDVHQVNLMNTDSLPGETANHRTKLDCLLPDCLHGCLPGPFLLSYSVFYFFPYFFVSGPCARLSWPPVSFWAHDNLPYRIVS